MRIAEPSVKRRTHYRSPGPLLQPGSRPKMLLWPEPAGQAGMLKR
ncbi:hypothetical protein NW859_02025 [Synechococcus sp. H55.5]